MGKDQKFAEQSTLSWMMGAVKRSDMEDAENRSRPVLIQYGVSWGLSLRRLIGMSAGARRRLALCVLGVYALILCTPGVTDPAIIVAYLLFGSLLLFLVALLLPDDRVYIDRLAFIIPSENIFNFNPKVLWSRIEEASIVDVAGPGKPSRFALRFTEASGESHDLFLSAFGRDGLPLLAETVEGYAPHVRGLVLLKELERFHDYQHGKLEGISYTQLWESGAALKFGLTSFTPLMSGVTLKDGSLKVEKQIAAGGFSAVYLITGSDGTNYVLKESVVPFNLDQELKNKAQEQFQREARILARLNHPRIAQVHDHFVENGRSYLQMEYIDGVSLREFVGERQFVSEATAVTWLQELAVILTYLHESAPPVVHRDLSPDNILVGKDERLVLIDFGAANEFVGAATGTLVGKHAYMAPEQIRANAEPRSDLYSLGACAYFFVTGRDPEPIRCSSPRAHGANVSDWFDGLVQRLTSMDRDQRFESARACLDFVERPS